MTPRYSLYVVTVLIGLAVLPSCGPSDNAKLPELPVRVTQRDSNKILDGHKVAIFTNTSSSTLSIVVTFENHAFDQRKTFNLVLRPNETKEIGWLEGWTLVPGETAHLSCPGYRNQYVTFKE